MNNKKAMSRRDFLRMAGGLAAGATLAACQPKTVIVEKEVERTVVVEKEVEKVVKETVIVEGTPKVVEKTVKEVVKELVTATPLPTIGPEKVTIFSAGADPEKPYSEDRVVKEMGNRTNTIVDIVKIDGGVFMDRLNAAIAADQTPEFICVIDMYNRGLHERWAKEGVIAAYEDEVAGEAPNIIAEYETIPVLEELKIDGKIYAEPVEWGFGMFPNMGLVHIRADLLEKYGMEPPETFDEWFEFAKKAVADGSTGIIAAGLGGGAQTASNPFVGAFNLPFRGWAKTATGYGFHGVQPGKKDALMLMRRMIKEEILDPGSWETATRQNFEAGQGCSLIYNGGGHIARIQNAMDVAEQGWKEWLIPAPDAGTGYRGYTTEQEFWNVTFLGGTKNNNTLAAARLMNFLTSDEGFRLRNLGIEGVHWRMEGAEIVLFHEERAKDNFAPAPALSHPTAASIDTWNPWEWQKWAMFWGKGEDFKEWFGLQYPTNQGMYQIPAYGMLISSPKWNEFYGMSNEMTNRAYVEVLQARSDDDAAVIFDKYVQDWMNAGGADATQEVSDRLKDIYG